MLAGEVNFRGNIYNHVVNAVDGYIPLCATSQGQSQLYIHIYNMAQILQE